MNRELWILKILEELAEMLPLGLGGQQLGPSQ